MRTKLLLGGTFALVSCFGVFTYLYARSIENELVVLNSTTGKERRISLADFLAQSFVDVEAQSYIRRAQQVMQSDDKGRLLLTPDVLTEGKPAPSEKKTIVLAGRGHDVIELGTDGTYARGGASSDHFVVQLGDAKAGETKLYRGDEGWDTVVLAKGFSIRNVVRRTPPYQVVDPKTGGRYELDVEALGVVDNLKGEDVSALSAERVDLFASGVGMAPRTVGGSTHYSSSSTNINTSGINSYDRRMDAVKKLREEIREAGAAKNPAGDGARADGAHPLPRDAVGIVPLGTQSDKPTVNPSGRYPLIFSIECGDFAVSSKNLLDEMVLRNNILAATISISANSLSDSQIRLRLLTEDEITLQGDIADPAAVEAVLGRLKKAGLVSDYTFRSDCHIEIELKDRTVILKPTLFVKRMGWVFAEPRVEPVETLDGRWAFAVIGVDGFAQTFFEVSRKAGGTAVEWADPVEKGLEAGLFHRLSDGIESKGVSVEELVPQPINRVMRYPPRGDNQYPFLAEVDGGLLFLMSEMPIEFGSMSARIENMTVSISSLFYARRLVNFTMSNGDRIFAVAALMDPEQSLTCLDNLQSRNVITGYRLTKELVGPLSLRFPSGKSGKMMPLLFGLHTGRKQVAMAVTRIVDGKGRFAFALVGQDGTAQGLVDIGGSTILPAFPKP